MVRRYSDEHEEKLLEGRDFMAAEEAPGINRQSKLQPSPYLSVSGS